MFWQREMAPMPKGKMYRSYGKMHSCGGCGFVPLRAVYISTVFTYGCKDGSENNWHETCSHLRA
jgi:hypothetical protein